MKRKKPLSAEGGTKRRRKGVKESSKTLCLPLGEKTFVKKVDFPQKDDGTVGRTIQDSLPLILKELVNAYTKLTYRASLLANAYLVYVSSKNVKLPSGSETFDFKLLYLKCLAFLKKGSYKKSLENAVNNHFPGLDEVAQQFLPPDGKPTIEFGFQNPLGYAAVAFETEMHNFKEWGDPFWMRSYLSAKYPHLSKAHLRFVANWVLWQVDAGSQFDKTKTPEGYGDTVSIIQEEYDLLLGFLSRDAIGRVRWRQMMRETIVGASTNERSFKSFTLAPIHKMGPRFMRFDGEVMSKLFYGKGYNSGSHYLPLNHFLSDASKQCFLKSGLSKSKEAGPASAVTNGYEIHFCFSYSIEEPLSSSSQEEKVNAELQKIGNDLDQSHFIGIDPGVHNLIASVSFDGEGNPTKRKLTREEWHHRTLNTRKKVMSDKLTKRARDGDQVIREGLDYISGHSLKTCLDYATTVEASQVYINVFIRLLPIYWNRRYMKFKFMARMREQAELDRAVDYVMGHGKQRPIIGFGNAGNLNGFKKVGPHGPSRKLFRHAQKRLRNRGIVVLIDEHCTTKYTSCCLEQHKYAVYQRYSRRRPGGYSEEHKGVLHCNKCGKTLSRDISAAKNILEILKFGCGFNNVELHQDFRPPFKATGRVVRVDDGTTPHAASPLEVNEDRYTRQITTTPNLLPGTLG